MKILSYITLAILLNASNCSTTKDFNGIKFGEGGGFTGAVTTYEINYNGELFKDKKKIKKVDKSDIKKIQSMINKLSDESNKFNHPFNIYYFIEFEKSNQKVNITWGDPAFQTPSDIQELYNGLTKHINQ